MPLLEQVLEKYPDDVKLVFKNFPLRSHKFASTAARAALSAGLQGKFWEYHDKLFESYNALNDRKLREIATDLGLDLAAFEAGIKTPSIQARINSDIQDGRAVGVRGTPSIFVNGRLLTNRSLEGFEDLIEKELSAAGK